MAGASASGSGRKAGAGKALTVDLEAFFRELQEAPKDESGAMPTQEIVEATGRSLHDVQALLRKAKAAGRLLVARVPREALDGAYRRVPGYILEG
jgi:hypothetical protein